MKKGKQFLKRHFKANPLSYLGWLGILGVLGIFFIPVFIPFLLCFTFFSYSKTVADELFWNNVHRAGTRGFWSVFALDVVVAVILFVRAMTYDGEYVETAFQDNTIFMGVFAYDQLMMVYLTFFAGITLMILVFSISMMRFRRMEKKLLEKEESIA